MVAASPKQRARENITEIVSVAVTGIWLAALMSGFDWWLAFMLFGYVVIVPVTALLFGDTEDVKEWWDEDAERWDEDTEEDGVAMNESSGAGQDDALATLRDRYARGDLTDEQFERKVERLLETETLEDVEDRVGAPDSGKSRRHDRNTEPDRNR